MEPRPKQPGSRAWKLLRIMSICMELGVHGARSSQVVPVVKNPPANTGDVRDTSSIPGSGRSPGRGNGNPVQYSCLENPTNRGAWRDTAHVVAKSWTWLKRLSRIQRPRDEFTEKMSLEPGFKEECNLQAGKLWVRIWALLIHWRWLCSAWGRENRFLYEFSGSPKAVRLSFSRWDRLPKEAACDEGSL